MQSDLEELKEKLDEAEVEKNKLKKLASDKDAQLEDLNQKILALTEGKKKGDTSLSSLQRDLETAQQNEKKQ